MYQQRSSHPQQKPRKNKEGDWICIKCSNYNYSFRDICNRCRQQGKQRNSRMMDALGKENYGENSFPSALFLHQFREADNQEEGDYLQSYSKGNGSYGYNAHQFQTEYGPNAFYHPNSQYCHQSQYDYENFYYRYHPQQYCQIQRDSRNVENRVFREINSNTQSQCYQSPTQKQGAFSSYQSNNCLFKPKDSRYQDKQIESRENVESQIEGQSDFEEAEDTWVSSLIDE